MSSAVETWLGAARVSRHADGKRYVSMCTCCELQLSDAQVKPRRRAVHKPVLAWRARLATLEAAQNPNANSGGRSE